MLLIKEKRVKEIDISRLVSEILVKAVVALWLAIPALSANSTAVIFGGGTPIDFGKKFYDGKRILGNGKTWRGLIGGGAAAAGIGGIQQIIAYFLNTPYLPLFSFNGFEAMGIVLVLSYGALIGDSTGSFIKRRFGIERGQKAYLLDQMTFLLVALLFVFIAYPSFFFGYFWNITAILTLFILTPLLHRSVNIIGYKMGYKDVPW